LQHLRFSRSKGEETGSYNVLQRLAYLTAIFGLFPFLIWTGLAMSPAFTAAFPFTVTVFGGHQSARTLHFFATILLVLFVLVHVLMVVISGFGARIQAMTVGSSKIRKDLA
jgi:thiosulfate reductase cytochrome b subunit